MLLNFSGFTEDTVAMLTMYEISHIMLNEFSPQPLKQGTRRKFSPLIGRINLNGNGVCKISEKFQLLEVKSKNLSRGRALNSHIGWKT